MSDDIVIARTLREANAARQKEWDPGSRLSITYRSNELAGECGEACNIAKKLERERLGIRGSRATVDQLADELADVVICADLIAMAEGIDLDAAVVRKFNATSEQVGLRTRLAPDPACSPAGGGTSTIVAPDGIEFAIVVYLVCDEDIEARITLSGLPALATTGDAIDAPRLLAVAARGMPVGTNWRLMTRAE
ncbi:MAG TPA: MazG-like family protein, partial [Beijerinckiaceae bacterium]|nr:MazG-like family protein [Beijerinckiaceae bacterium]